MTMLSVLTETSTPTATGMDAMLEVMKSVVDFSLECFTTITTNPILAFIFAGSLVGVGISVFRKFKRAAGN